MRTPASGPLFTHRLNTRNDSQKKKKPKLQPALRTNCKDEKLITTSVTPRHERLMPRTFSQSVRASSWRCSYRHWLSPDSTFRMFADKIFWLHWKHINDRTKKKKKNESNCCVRTFRCHAFGDDCLVDEYSLYRLSWPSIFPQTEISPFRIINRVEPHHIGSLSLAMEKKKKKQRKTKNHRKAPDSVQRENLFFMCYFVVTRFVFHVRRQCRAHPSRPVPVPPFEAAPAFICLTIIFYSEETHTL